jgi:hypothetical protein
VPTVLAEKRHLVDVLRERMNADIDWEALKDETNYLGVSELFIDRILAELRKQTL